jgi:glycerophosphoryl diester phosphodiesterase
MAGILGLALLTAASVQADAVRAEVMPPLSAVQTCRADHIRSLLFERSTGRILVVAHRGVHDTVPENSIAGIERAIALGVSVVEIDVRRTADGQYVLMHDSTLERTTDRSGRIRDTRWTDLRSARLRRDDGTLTGERVPTLAEAFDAGKGRIWIMIDSKVDGPEEVAAIMRIARERGVLGQTILYDFKPGLLVRYRELAPEAKVMGRTKKREQVAEIVNRVRPDIFHIEPDYNSAALGRQFDRLGVPTWLNVIGPIDAKAREVGDDLAYRAQLSFQPDLVQTDRPAELIALLRQKRLHPAGLDGDRCNPMEPKK